MTDKILCPWCGAEMKNSTRPCGKKFVSEMECLLCGAKGPAGWGVTNRKAEEVARAAALRRYTPPLKPMTLEEVNEKSKNISDNVIWLERPDEEYGYDDTECIPALVSNFSRLGANSLRYVRFLVWPKQEIVYPIIDESDYGKTWRCWSRKPTEEERGAAGWET